MKLAFGIEYNGAFYHGWQSQDGLSTIQDKLEEAFSFVAGEKLKIVCSGRTDTGVHALSQVIHLETNAKRKPFAWLVGVNTKLKNEHISVTWMREVDDEFHARFSAKKRRYIYTIYNSTIPCAVSKQNLSWVYHKLDIIRMQKAASFLVGRHDFSAFRASNCQAKTPVREIFSFKVCEKVLSCEHPNSSDLKNPQTRLIILDIIGNAFLYHMVRNIAGLLIKIGKGDLEPYMAEQLLEKKDRQLCPATADANGLYFIGSYYDDIYNLPEAKLPWFLEGGLAYES